MGMWVADPWPDQDSPTAPIPPQHLFALRRFALEILASEQLAALSVPSAQNPRPDTHVLYSFEPGADPVANRALDVAAYYLRNKALKEAGQRRDIHTIERSVELLNELMGPLQTWLGEERIHIGDYSAAEKNFRAALLSQPDNHSAQYGLGYCLRELALHDDAEEVLAKAVRVKPDHVPSRLALANLYLKVDRFVDAIQEYEAILAIEPANEIARINLNAALEHHAGAGHGIRTD
jgi:tetratricopeptide (TPR) repeat protein